MATLSLYFVEVCPAAPLPDQRPAGVGDQGAERSLQPFPLPARAEGDAHGPDVLTPVCRRGNSHPRTARSVPGRASCRGRSCLSPPSFHRIDTSAAVRNGISPLLRKRYNRVHGHALAFRASPMARRVRGRGAASSSAPHALRVHPYLQACPRRRAVPRIRHDGGLSRVVRGEPSRVARLREMNGGRVRVSAGGRNP
jgi:hypothetical protein